MMNLLTSESDAQKMRAAIELRRHLVESVPEEQGYACPHPEWFDEATPSVVDSTVCLNCIQSHACTLGQKKGEWVDVQPLGGSSIPPRASLMDAFSNPDESHVPLPRDPFFGFSLNAGRTRTLYICEVDALNTLLPCQHQPSAPIRTVVGMDRKTGQLLWPFDQLFIRIIHNPPVGGFQFKSDRAGPLTRIDKDLLEVAAMYHGWIDEHDDASLGILADLVSVIITSMKRKENEVHLKDLMFMSTKLGVDHPYNAGGSGPMLLALRWLHHRPDDFQHIFDRLDVGAPLRQRMGLRNDGTIREPLKSRRDSIPHDDTSNAQDEGLRFLPRFPAVAFIPELPDTAVQIDLPQCRIINVFLHAGETSYLLIDGLGVDLEEEVMQSE